MQVGVTGSHGLVGSRLVSYLTSLGHQVIRLTRPPIDATRNPQGEVDGLDEAICPVNFSWSDLDSTAIRDKDFFEIFKSIPAGVEFVGCRIPAAPVAS